MEVTLYNARTLLAGDLIVISQIYTGGHRKKWWEFFRQRRLKWRVKQPLTVRLSNNEVITIPENFETDLCSVPRVFWAIAAPYGDFLLASVIHDYLYVYNIGDRYFADKEMLKWSGAIWDNMADNLLRYHMVRLFGNGWWQKAAARIARERNNQEN